MNTRLKVKCIPLFCLVTKPTLIHHFRNKKGPVRNNGQQKEITFLGIFGKDQKSTTWLQNCLEVVRLCRNLGKLYGYENHTLRKCWQIIIKFALTLTTILIAFFFYSSHQKTICMNTSEMEPGRWSYMYHTVNM